MTPMSDAEAIYFAALEKRTPQERAAYLEEACGGNQALRRRVERLLAALPHMGTFLEQPAMLALGSAGAAVAADWFVAPLQSATGSLGL